MSDVSTWETLAEALTKHVGGLQAERQAAFLTLVIARLIAEAEERGAAKVRERVLAVIPSWSSGDIRHNNGMTHTSGIQCDACPGYPHATCVSASDLRAALTDETAP